MAINDSKNIPETPIDLERLLPEAVAQALGDENPETLRIWLRQNLPRFSDPALRSGASPGMFDAMAAQFWFMLWNALPLPGNGFAPRPLPMPGRNDPCLCGSGRKY